MRSRAPQNGGMLPDTREEGRLTARPGHAAGPATTGHFGLNEKEEKKEKGGGGCALHLPLTRLSSLRNRKP